MSGRRMRRPPAKSVEELDYPCQPERGLGGHLKTGHMWSPQNRPTERTQNKSSYTLSAAIPANFSANESGVSLILTAPGRKTRQRRDATGAPTQGPEWRGGAGRPDRAILAEKR